MPTRPNATNLSAGAVDILNAIRNSATANYRNYVPAATQDLDSIREIGAVIMQFPALQNEFLSALVNRIGRVMITSKMYTNPWAIFKQGTLEFGETIEEIFVNIAKPFQYDPAVAESKVFKREIPDVRAAFHILNYQKFYKATIQNEQLRQAFLSWQGITDLIAKIVDSMYTAAAYDEFQVMKYLLAKHIVRGELFPVKVPDLRQDDSPATYRSIVGTIKGVSNNLTFMSDKYNLAGVANVSSKDDQFIIVNADFDATMDVEVLASAFNMSKADFIGHRVMIDNFGDLDEARLTLLFADDPSYEPISDEEKEALNMCPAVLVDRNYFMIFDNLYNFTEQYNGEGLYWNYWYHVWKTFSVSPFANAVVFVPDTPSVTSVTVTPDAVTTTPGVSLQLTATVVTMGYESQAVTWSATVNGTEAEGIVDVYGKVTIPDDASDGDEIVVTATSVKDSTKSDSCTITIDIPE